MDCLCSKGLTGSRTGSAGRVSLPDANRLVSLSSGGIHTCALTSTGVAYCWGADYATFGRDVSSTDVAPRVAAGGMQFRAISAGQVHVCGLDAGGRLRCLGDSIRGALGIR